MSSGQIYIGLAVLAIILLLSSKYMGRQIKSGFFNNDCGDGCQGPRIGSCVADCSVSCREPYSARENFSARAEKFSPDSIAWVPLQKKYKSACQVVDMTPLANAANIEEAALIAVNGGASL